ncbi:M23 family metallopeptidase [Streptacidiphilus sp. P02-A3a]|uniref:M23 family metallopeptidase n=1 Tax=Streptacidiphilus sp. P02-A3a TaxID=2704468 RepID=UPI0015F9DBF2|nr:M23 family metallopeptidase [Streptacidiphilus sp. P02-A3a]QMU73176.1 M23 family metallopeptidase [Streptacidiphilus sp. P02-A3a]
MASYQSTWAPVQPEAPQRPAGIAPSAVLGLAAMAAVGATGAIGLATPARAATISDSLATGAKPSLSVRDHFSGELPAGATALSGRATDPGTALADRIRTQAAQQRADAGDTARRQAAQVAAAKLAARADAETAAAQAQAQAAAQAQAQAATEAEAQAKAEAAAHAAQAAAHVQAQAAAQAEAERAAAAQAAAEAQQLGPLVAPVQGAVVGAGFGQSGSYWAQLHTGLDLAAPNGTPVVAIGKGVIASAGWAGSYGYRVVETLPDGTELWYCHLSAIGVGAGEVTSGQPIGRVGATGNVSTIAGPHLHLEVRPGGGEPIDPATWLAEHGLTI